MNATRYTAGSPIWKTAGKTLGGKQISWGQLDKQAPFAAIRRPGGEFRDPKPMRHPHVPHALIALSIQPREHS